MTQQTKDDDAPYSFIEVTRMSDEAYKFMEELRMRKQQTKGEEIAKSPRPI